MVAGTVTFYLCILFIHVMAVVIGFGPTFVYPLIWRATRNNAPRTLPHMLRTVERIGKTVIGPSTLLILLSGIYLVEKGPFDWSSTFVQVALPILVVLIFAGPLYFARTEAKLADLAERDVAASGEGDVTLSDEFLSLLGQVTLVNRLANLAILVALFFMVVKP